MTGSNGVYTRRNDTCISYSVNELYSRLSLRTIHVDIDEEVNHGGRRTRRTPGDGKFKFFQGRLSSSSLPLQRFMDYPGFLKSLSVVDVADRLID